MNAEGRYSITALFFSSILVLLCSTEESISKHIEKVHSYGVVAICRNKVILSFGH